jgi:hypothetical protein
MYGSFQHTGTASHFSDPYNIILPWEHLLDHAHFPVHRCLVLLLRKDKSAWLEVREGRSPLLPLLKCVQIILGPP